MSQNRALAGQATQPVTIQSSTLQAAFTGDKKSREARDAEEVCTTDQPGTVTY